MTGMEKSAICFLDIMPRPWNRILAAQVRLRLMMTSDKVPAFQKEITELTAASVLPQTVKEICADLE